ncbi:MAG: RidA family protein [Candidatus Peribacteraceae bacterium]|nr:RidA family protein [Candidatus Peribacteraceae bacterium]
MQIVTTKAAPEAIGPYSQAIVSDGFVFTSGQIALKPDGEFLDGTIEEQARQALGNLREVLNAAGSDFSKVLKTTIFLASIDDFAKVNEIYAEFFGAAKPARSTVAVSALPKNAKVEIEAIAKI